MTSFEFIALIGITTTTVLTVFIYAYVLEILRILKTEK